LRGEEWNKRTHELVVQARRRTAHDVQGGPSLYRRLVRRNQPRQLGCRQQALDELGSLARQRPREDAVVEGNVIDERQPLGQVSSQCLRLERSDGSAKQRIHEMSCMATFDERQATLRIVALHDLETPPVI